MTEGVVCQHCETRVSLVEIGEHLIGHESIVDESHIAEAFIGENRSIDRLEPDGVHRMVREEAEDRASDSQRLAGGFRNRPWAVPS